MWLHLLLAGNNIQLIFQFRNLTPRVEPEITLYLRYNECMPQPVVVYCLNMSQKGNWYANNAKYVETFWWWKLAYKKGIIPILRRAQQWIWIVHISLSANLWYISKWCHNIDSHVRFGSLAFAVTAARTRTQKTHGALKTNKNKYINSPTYSFFIMMKIETYKLFSIAMWWKTLNIKWCNDLRISLISNIVSISDNPLAL